jgi:hypothetical protein
MSTVQHYPRSKVRNTPPVGTQFYTSSTISYEQLPKNQRDMDNTIYRSGSELPDYNMHPNVPCFAWVGGKQVWQNFDGLKIPQSLLRKYGIKSYDQIDEILKMLEDETVFVGFASKETVNPNTGVDWDIKVAVEIDHPKAVRITEPKGVKIGDWIKPQIPDPRIKDNRYYATFVKVERSPENVAIKQMISLQNIVYEGEGLAQLTF